jgi:sodium-dependent dicarboxylate transporter 2/3/5
MKLSLPSVPRSWLFWLGPLLFTVAIVFNPLGLDDKACKVIAVAALMITWWISEALPMPAVALTPLFLFPLLGIATISETAAPYANEVIFLFMGGFMIGLAIEKWHLHKRIALTIVKWTGTSGDRIILGFIISTGFISMWLSNTATTMMMFPIATSVISVVHEDGIDTKKAANFSLCIMLSIAYASNFGGIATIIGTPPNVAYASFINKHYGYDISFANWMIICLPIAILLCYGLYLIMVKWLFPNRIEASPEMHRKIMTDLEALGPMTPSEKRVMWIFVLTAGLWITRDLINQLHLFKLDDNMIAVLGALLMFIVPAGNKENKDEKLLDWSDTKKMAWGILLLFGGGITLANALQNAGLIELLGQWIAHYSGTDVLLILIVVTVVSIFMSEVMSNIAQVIVLAPVVTGIADALHMNPFMLGIPMTLAASCASMMPMGTPPNAIVFASGHIQLRQMIKVGLIMNVMSIVLIVLFSYFILPHFLFL